MCFLLFTYLLFYIDYIVESSVNWPNVQLPFIIIFLFYSVLYDFIFVTWTLPVPVAARFKVWVCGHSLAGIAGSNPTGYMDVCLLCVQCVIRCMSLPGADRSSRGVLPRVVCPVSDREAPLRGGYYSE